MRAEDALALAKSYVKKSLAGAGAIKGDKGDPGSDGFSPIVSIDKFGSETTISITDATHQETAKVLDGVDGEEYTYYEYDEAKLTKEQYKQYIAELSVADIQQQRADIDYIALMMGVDLEG